jgi:hypothetical protein
MSAVLRKWPTTFRERYQTAHAVDVLSQNVCSDVGLRPLPVGAGPPSVHRGGRQRRRGIVGDCGTMRDVSRSPSGMARVQRLFSAIVFANKRFIWNDLFRFHDSLRFDFEKSKARLSGRAKPSTQKLLHSDGRTAIRRRVCPREAAHTNLLRKPSGADGASSSKDHRAEAIDLFCESPAEPDFRFDNTAMLSIGAQI